MEENQPGSPPPPDDRRPLPPEPDSEEKVDFVKNLRWFVARFTALLGAVVLLGAVATGFAGWYTSRPDFCRSCHIMEPYHDSWAESTHAHVSCVDCHFPPGVGEKARGKVLGLVQLAKYVTGTHGPRPVAEVPDESCLRSGCHDTRLLSGRIDFEGMPFDHASHLGEMRRGMTLRCTSCHSQIVQDVHMTVTKTTCFLCHFKEVPFNEGVGACTRCHQIPEKDYQLGGGNVFNHELAFEKGVDCAKCHSDLIRGAGAVPVERCHFCHLRPEDLARIDDPLFMHQKHVSDHKVDCLSCHLEIEHSLDPRRLEHSASDCASCHPGHHQQQVAMMEGMGALSVQAPRTGMAAIRIACQSCHQPASASAADAATWRASMDTCLQCHDRQMTDWLASYHLTLREALAGLEAVVVRARDALPGAALTEDAARQTAAQLDDIEHDVKFLRIGNGIHNIHYASTLTRGLVDQLTELSRKLDLPEPEIVLPDPPASETVEPETTEPETTEPSEPEAGPPDRDEPDAPEQNAAPPQAKEPAIEEPRDAPPPAADADAATPED